MYKYLFIFLLAFATAFANPIKVGAKVPDFSFTATDGKQHTIKSLRGKLVLIDFWASWCGPCRVSNEILVDVYNKYNRYGFEIVSISLDVKKEAWKKAINEDGLKWPLQANDPKGWDSPLAVMFGVDQLPTSFLISEEGNILALDPEADALGNLLKKYFTSNLKCYPEKAANRLLLNLEAKYEVLNAEGKTILKNSGKDIDVTPLKPGSYMLKANGKNVVFTKISIKDPVMFYPKRADTKLTFSKDCEYVIFNAVGTKVKHGKAIEVDISDLSEGVYQLSLEGWVDNFLKK